MLQHYLKVLSLFFIIFAYTKLQSQVNCSDPKFGAPIISDVEITYPSVCSSQTTASISVDADVVGGGIGYEGSWRFSLDGINWQASSVFSNLSPGTYTVSVKDIETLCDDSQVVVIETITPYDVEVSTINTDPSSYCTSDGEITVNVTGGGSPYQYRINGGAWTSNNVFTGLDEGTYTIEVSTHNGTCTTSTIENLDAISPPLINQVNKTNSTDCASPNGSIEIIATPASQFLYSIDGGNTWSSNPIFENLSAGNYPIRVRYTWDEECVRLPNPSTVTISSPNPINISSAPTTPASACSASDGKITINATGSSTLYYRVDGGQWQSSKTITGLTPGNYNVYVRYANGTCITPFSGNPVAVGPNDLQINNVNTTPPTTCSSTQGNGSITIQAQNNDNPILYSINGGQTYSSNNTFTGLSSGTYSVMVANSNQSCPIAYGPVTLPPPTAITIQSVNKTSPTDCNMLNGAMSIVVSPSGSYQYSINGGQTFQSSPTFNNLAQGIYNIVVKTAGGECTVTYNNNPVQLQALTCLEICNDGIDNDGNGQIDNCADSNCGLTPMQVQVTQPTCPNATPTGSIAINTAIPSKDCSNLAAGDIVITNTSAFITGSFKFVPKVNILGGTQIIFTDKEWTGVGFSSSEGLVQWTAPSGGLAAGTLVTISKSFTTWTASHGTALGDESIPNYQNYDSSNPDFRFDSNYGDNLIALCGNSFASGEISQIKFLFSLDFDVFTSTTPPGLVAGVTAITSPGQYGATYPAPVIDTIKYSINGGQTWQTSSTFSNLSPGFYKVLVKFGNCITAYSGNPVQIFACQEICNDGVDNDGNGYADCADGACGVASYTFSAMQPGCPPQATTGSITITPSNPANNLYSIDNGATWHGMPIFSSLIPGSYQVSVKRTDSGCILSYSNNTVNLESPTCYEICDDGVDNDGDGDVDCEDSDCGIAADFALDITEPGCPAGSANGVISISNASPPVFKDCSNLQAGDIAITFYDADPDRFTFVPKVNIAEGTKIIFTDKGYKPAYTEDGFTFPATMRSAEGLAQWTAPTGGVLAGTQITINYVPASATVGTVLFDESIPGYSAYDSNNPSFALITAGDQLIALCGTSLNVNQVTFLFAVHANGNNWDSDSNSDGASAIPAGLIDGVTAIAVGDVPEATIPLAPIPPSMTYAYSIDGGQSFDTSGIFSNLAAGNYEILIQNQASGCVAPYSLDSITLQAPDCLEICDDGIDNDGNGLIDCADTACAVAPFDLTITQPTCPASVQSGGITFVPSDSRDYLYSIDGGSTTQADPNFENLSPGEYHIWIQAVESGCQGEQDTIVLIAPDCPELCNDGIDNDGNGLIDCEDPDAPCYVAPYEVEVVQPLSTINTASGMINILPSDSKTYKFSIDSGFTKLDLPIFNDLTPGTYNVVVYTTNCAKAYEDNPIALQLPPPHSGAGEDKMTCPGSTCVTIGAENQNPDYCYNWEAAEGLDENERFSPNPCVNPSQTTTYRLHIIDENDDLIETDEVMVTVKRAPVAEIVATETVICPGVTSQLGVNPPGVNTYLWSTGATTKKIAVDEPGTYSVTITNINTCQATASIEIKAAEDIEIELQPDPAVLCLGETLTLSAPEGFSSYQWSTADGNIFSAQDTREIEVNAVGTYEVEVTHANGCESMDDVDVVNNDPQSIKALLEAKGFVCIPINVVGPPPGIKEKDTAKNKSNIIESCSSLNFTIDGEGSEIIDLEADLSRELGYALADGHSAIGKIADLSCLCSNPNFLQEFLNTSEYDAAALSFIYDEPNSEDDCLLLYFKQPEVPIISIQDDETPFPFEPDCDGNSSVLNDCCGHENGGYTYPTVLNENNKFYNYQCVFGNWTKGDLLEEVIQDFQPVDDDPQLIGCYNGTSTPMTWKNAPSKNAYALQYVPTATLCAIHKGAFLGAALPSNAAHSIGTQLIQKFTDPNEHTEPIALTCDDPRVKVIANKNTVKNTLASIKNIIKNYYENNQTFNGLFNGTPSNFGGGRVPIPDFNLLSEGLPFVAILGGTQYLKVKVVKAVQETNCDAPRVPGQKIKVKITGIITIGDTYGVSADHDVAERYVPGLPSFWILQNYRCWDTYGSLNCCTNPPCFKPFRWTLDVPFEVDAYITVP